MTPRSGRALQAAMLHSSATDAATTETILRVLEGLPTSAVYVFGSAAAARMRPDSDIDLAVLPAASLPAVKLMNIRTELSEHLSRDVDLIDLSLASTVLRKEVVAGGRLLFEADPLARAEFEMYTLSDYARLSEERAPVLAAIGHPLEPHA